MTWNLCRIDLSCPFCVAGVARSIVTPLKGNKLKSFSRGERILGGKGLQCEDSTSISFVRPVYSHMYTYVYIRIICGVYKWYCNAEIQ